MKCWGWAAMATKEHEKWNVSLIGKIKSWKKYSSCVICPQNYVFAYILL